MFHSFKKPSASPVTTMFFDGRGHTRVIGPLPSILLTEAEPIEFVAGSTIALSLRLLSQSGSTISKTPSDLPTTMDEQSGSQPNDTRSPCKADRPMPTKAARPVCNLLPGGRLSFDRLIGINLFALARISGAGGGTLRQWPSACNASTWPPSVNATTQCSRSSNSNPRRKSKTRSAHKAACQAGACTSYR